MTNRILIADDNQANVELLEAYLVDISCDVEVAIDGQDTLNKVPTFKPDLILLDVMMPKLSGFEVCETIKNNPQTSNIMILMVTALNELGDIQRAVDAGTDDFFAETGQQSGVDQTGGEYASAQRHQRRKRAASSLY